MPDPAVVASKRRRLRAFNSLFEMLLLYFLRFKALQKILSILYLRCRRESAEVLALDLPNLSILYLRCATLMFASGVVFKQFDFQFSI